MKRFPLSVTLITLNEEANLPRALESVRWAEEVIVVDSGSTDRTEAIAREFGAKFFHRDWTGYGQQKNFAQSMASHDWVLNIDADEAVSPELAHRIQGVLEVQIQGAEKVVGYRIPRKTFFCGRWIRYGGWYPNRQMRLVNRHVAHWTEPEVHEELLVEGVHRNLDEPLYHWSFPTIESQVRTNLRFSTLGSARLLREGRKPDLLRLFFKPFGKFMECYFIKNGYKDGVAGFIIAVNAAHSMFLKFANLHEPVIQAQGRRQQEREKSHADSRH